MPYDVYVCGCVCMARFDFLTLDFHNHKKDESLIFLVCSVLARTVFKTSWPHKRFRKRLSCFYSWTIKSTLNVWMCSQWHSLDLWCPLKSKWKSLSCVRLFATHRLYSPCHSLGQNSGVGSLFPSPGNLPNPGIEPRSPALWEDSLPAESQGKWKNTGVGSLSLL